MYTTDPLLVTLAELTKSDELTSSVIGQATKIIHDDMALNGDADAMATLGDMAENSPEFREFVAMYLAFMASRSGMGHDFIIHAEAMHIHGIMIGLLAAEILKEQNVRKS